jgi:TrmH family RNA methyltransferase
MQIPVRIVLVDTSHPGNIGASARAMKTMGLSDLVLVRPRTFPSDEATARASGAADILASARVVDSLDAALADCSFVVGASARERGVAWPTLDPRAAAEAVHMEAEANRVAILFGPEQSGLTNDDVARCHRLVRIPTSAEFGSLNLAMAVQVLCYELRMTWLLRAAAQGTAVQGIAAQGIAAYGITAPGVAAQGTAAQGTAALGAAARGTSAAAEPLATGAELEHFYAHLERVLDDAGFLHGDHPRQLKLKLRRIFQRAELNRNEVNILRGMLTALDPSRRAGLDAS